MVTDCGKCTRGRVVEEGFDGRTGRQCPDCRGAGEIELSPEEEAILSRFLEACAASVAAHPDAPVLTPPAAPAVGTRRLANPARWQRALARAFASELALYQDTLSGAWLVTSQSRPGVVHTTDGTECSCEAHMLGGDPVCAHRALYWHHQGMLDLEAPATVAPVRPVILFPILAA